MPEHMTKTEARAAIRRVREALRGFEDALRTDDLGELDEWAGEVNGAAAMLFDYADARREGAQ